MAATTIGFRSLAAALLFSALALGCGQAVMAVPAELGAGADVYSVSGHQGLLIFNPNIRFGPFSTDKVRRGFTVGSGELEPGLTSSTTKREDHQVSTFSMQAWRGMCEARHASERTTETTGVGISSQHGVYAEQRQSTVESSSYVCELTERAGKRLRLELDGTSGWVVDSEGSTVYSLSTMREPMTMKHPELRGYLIDSKSGSVAAVQTSFDGVVYFSRLLDARQRAEVAAVCVAVFLHRD